MFIGDKDDRPKPNLPKWKVSTHSDVQCGSANWQTFFSGRGNARIKLPFSGPITNKFRRPTILQLNIEGLTASKMNVLHHLAMQSEALVILLQETALMQKSWYFQTTNWLGVIQAESMALPRLSTSD